MSAEPYASTLLAALGQRTGACSASSSCVVRSGDHASDLDSDLVGKRNPIPLADEEKHGFTSLSSRGTSI